MKGRLSFVLVFVCVFVLAPLAQAQPTARQRFAGVKRWRVHYTYSMNSPHTWEEGGTTFNRHTWTESQSGVIELTTTNFGDVLVAEGTNKGAASLNKASRDVGWGDSLETRYDRGAGQPEVGVQLIIYFDENCYDISFHSGDFDVVYGGRKKWSFNDHTYGPNNSVYSVAMPVPAPAEKKLLLPSSGRSLADSWSWEERWNHEEKTEPSFDRQKCYQHSPKTGTLRWTIVPAEPIDAELFIEAQNYDKWMPLGGKDEKTAGTLLPIKATLVGKDGGPSPVKARKMTFTLASVSREKGVCLNRPLKDASDAPDLGFEAEKNNGATIGDNGGSLTTAEGELTEATAQLSSFDYGAYGSVSVTAELVDGRVLVGKLKTGDATELLVPKRAPDSLIADAWKEAVGYKGADADDEDKQTGNDKPGDGLTAYEEYRGLSVRGRHARTRPEKKELVVINTLGNTAKQGFALFKSAADIEVIDAAKADLPESRQVNINSTTTRGGDQFAELLLNEAIASGYAGENRPAEELGKTPRKSEAAVVDLASAAQFFTAQSKLAKAANMPMPYTLEEDIANTIAHEIAHGVGAPHHGKAGRYNGRLTVTSRMTSYPVFGADGVQIQIKEDKDFKLQGQVGGRGNDASGDADCIMCYTNYYTWAAVGPESGPWQFHFVGPQPLGKTFCKSPQGTGMNAPHKRYNDTEAPGFFGDAPGQGGNAAVGNCLNAMNVRDW